MTSHRLTIRVKEGLEHISTVKSTFVIVIVLLLPRDLDGQTIIVVCVSPCCIKGWIIVARCFNFPALVLNPTVEWRTWSEALLLKSFCGVRVCLFVQLAFWLKVRHF
jgi:hypothetical protein